MSWCFSRKRSDNKQQILEKEKNRDCTFATMFGATSLATLALAPTVPAAIPVAIVSGISAAQNYHKYLDKIDAIYIEKEKQRNDLFYGRVINNLREYDL